MLKSSYTEFNHLNSRCRRDIFNPWIWTLVDFTDFDKIFQKPTNTETWSVPRCCFCGYWKILCNQCLCITKPDREINRTMQQQQMFSKKRCSFFRPSKFHNNILMNVKSNTKTFRVAPTMSGRVECLCETIYFIPVIALIN